MFAMPSNEWHVSVDGSHLMGHVLCWVASPAVLLPLSQIHSALTGLINNTTAIRWQSDQTLLIAKFRVVGQLPRLWHVTSDRLTGFIREFIGVYIVNELCAKIDVTASMEAPTELTKSKTETRINELSAFMFSRQILGFEHINMIHVFSNYVINTCTTRHNCVTMS